eukprot:COSAG04_NODE_1158_length_8038_cov_2.977201_5_plen_104_part_00
MAPRPTTADRGPHPASRYIIKRGLIPQPDLQPFVDYLWDEMVPMLDRTDPATWVEPGKNPKVKGWGPNAELVAMAAGAGADARSGRAMDTEGGVNRPYPAGWR